MVAELRGAVSIAMPLEQSLIAPVMRAAEDLLLELTGLNRLSLSHSWEQLYPPAPFLPTKSSLCEDLKTAAEHLICAHNLASFMLGELRYAVLKAPPMAKEMIRQCCLTAEDVQMSLAELNAAT